ncbi:MAG: DUF1016 domain-containing protein [Armatimonadetes bacterium]|nr:DUF1016 domain-containing protein [Armatimonadota bacterium]
MSMISEECEGFLAELKEHIGTAQVRAAVSVNRELVQLYWQIGRGILERQEQLGWGAAVIDRLSADLRQAFPEMKGFSPRNLKYMRAFAAAWPDEPIVQEALAQIPWYHHVVLLTRLQRPDERLWYVQQTAANGWSSNVLVHQIETGLIRRLGAGQSNFERTLPAPQSDLAEQLLKDPYNFDFLTLGDAAHERELHRGLLAHLREFLIELGVGFAFVGSQYPLTVGNSDFYVDLLFYHLRLRCFVVVELKVGDFQPEYTGKLNFYLSAVDDLVRHPDDQPSIGILLRKTPDRLVVEYALRDVSKPIGVATYQLVGALPEDLEGRLPTVEELEAELAGAHVE